MINRDQAFWGNQTKAGMALLPSLDDHGPGTSIHGAPLDQSRRAWELGDDLLHLAYQASLLQATPLVGAEMLHMGQLLAFRQPPEDGDKPTPQTQGFTDSRLVRGSADMPRSALKGNSFHCRASRSVSFTVPK
jgi:hypothetical protein